MTLSIAEHPLANLAVFRFNRLRTIVNLVLYAGFAVALIVAGLFLRGQFDLAAGGVAYGALGVWGLCIASSLWRALSKSRDLLHAATNVLLVAPFGVVRRLRHEVRAWSFAEFPDLQVVSRQGSIESIYLNPHGAKFGQLLVDDGSFGSMRDIAQALQASRSSTQAMP